MVTPPDGRPTAVLDASALLAVFQREEGMEVAMPYLDGGALSAVNYSEVVLKVRQHRLSIPNLREDLQTLGVRVLSFVPEQGEVAARLWDTTHELGLSFADRACIALGVMLDVPVLTTDQAWKGVSSARILLIR